MFSFLEPIGKVLDAIAPGHVPIQLQRLGAAERLPVVLEALEMIPILGIGEAATAGEFEDVGMRSEVVD